MNRYGNKVGCHTPKTSEKLFNRIESHTEVKWVDSSWHNDTCDSMEWTILDDGKKHKFIQIFFPNSFVNDPSNEEFNTFHIFNENVDSLLQTKDIQEVIEFINTMPTIGTKSEDLLW
jgi:hypothetical protein